MITTETIENYILNLDLPYESIGESIWVLYESDSNIKEKLIVALQEPLVHFRIKVLDIPSDTTKHCDLFKKLLEFNAVGLPHGAFAIDGISIVLVDSLEVENLDFNEFQASVEALFFGIMEAYKELADFVNT